MPLSFLTDYSELNVHFARLAPLFERVVHKTTRGEFNVEDLSRLAKQGHLTIGMIEQDGQVQLAMAFEFIAYPRFTAINILALAGRGIAEAFDKFGNSFKTWCKGAGVERIEAFCRPAMSRLLRR